MISMKYVVLKNSLSFLCVQLPEGFGTKLEIICFESQAEFDEYLKENRSGICQAGFAKPVPDAEEYPGHPLSHQEGIFVHHHDYYKKVLFSDIAWVEAARSYCCIQTVGKTNFIVTFPLAEVKKKLPSELFIQTHRSFLVNVNLVEKFIGNVLYVGEKSIPISRKFKKEVLEQFSFLDNVKDTLGKNILPSGKPNPPLEKKIGSEDENEVISDDEGL